jgi:hypothetical protein
VFCPVFVDECDPNPVVGSVHVPFQVIVDILFPWCWGLDMLMFGRFRS